jgi:hypothetical protein
VEVELIRENPGSKLVQEFASADGCLQPLAGKKTSALSRLRCLPAINPTAATAAPINPTATATAAIDPAPASNSPPAIDPAARSRLWGSGNPNTPADCCHHRRTRPLPNAPQK